MRIHVDEVKNKDHLVSKKSRGFRAHHHSIKIKKRNPPEDYCRKNMVGHVIKINPSCMICGKEFPSMKSLFGHMRCHPDRDWRGIRPPSAAKNSSDHSCNSLSDAETQKGWPVAARRGRKALTAADSTWGSSEEHQLHKAVDDLMMLGRGISSCRNQQSHSQNIYASEAASSKLLVSSADSGSKSNKPKISKSSAKFRTNSPEETDVELGPVLGESVSKLDGSVLNYDQLVDRDCDSPKLDNMIRKKIRKKVKLSELEQAPKISPVTPEQQKTAAGVAANSRCATCGKSFSSHQALGSHNRLKISILDSIGKSSNGGPRLNFPAAHQALGSHKVCCRSRPTGGPTSQRVSASSRRLLNFDLNELPPSED
ncbi:Zinc finger protein ZAT2 [Sesamum alatum]|uniref:Zinc finger protein ZAT2 n=1 Tax=Sesamum alatum TaxID=300844 RepID=A0AAE1XYU2_9LAMI|nr:Zinc finger protein ZAT2 [Sesamum alatum]